MNINKTWMNTLAKSIQSNRILIISHLGNNNKYHRKHQPNLQLINNRLPNKSINQLASLYNNNLLIYQKSVQGFVIV